MQKPGDIGRKSMDPACDVETNQASTLLRQVAKSEVSKQAFFDASWLMESRPPMIPAMIPAMIPYAACPIHFQTLMRTSFPMLPIEVARSQSAAAHHGHTPPFERPGSANPTCHAAECCEPLWKWLLCHLPSSYTLILTSPGNVGHELGYKNKKKLNIYMCMYIYIYMYKQEQAKNAWKLSQFVLVPWLQTMDQLLSWISCGLREHLKWWLNHSILHIGVSDRKG